MVKDHTLVFPRLIWIFAMMYLMFLDYPMKLIVGANMIMYLVYMFNSFIYFFTSKLYLRGQKPVRDYMRKHWYTVILLPIYRFIVFFMRMAGIINAVEKKASWSTKSLSEETGVLRNKLNEGLKPYYRVKEWVNNG
jgi:hypothetical protein